RGWLRLTRGNLRSGTVRTRRYPGSCRAVTAIPAQANGCHMERASHPLSELPGSPEGFPS
ncbi:unnamed protein product, partial [Coccothraustes coccothraustes]